MDSYLFMKKLAQDLKKGEKIKVSDQSCVIEEIELSDVGKQGKRKCRIVAKTEKGERVIIIRPADYPFIVE
jgi:translation elongation factor P/translation initiation factor 5A